MENLHVDILFHPTGRALGRREPIEVDIDAVIAAAKRTGTVLTASRQSLHPADESRLAFGRGETRLTGRSTAGGPSSYLGS